MPPAARRSPWRSPTSVRAWTWAAVVLSTGVCAAISWQHYEQVETLARTERIIDSVREARVDLARGFLYVVLGSEGRSAYRREEGLALLEQAIDTLERSELWASADGEEPPVGAPTREDLERSVAEFRARLSAWDANRGADHAVLGLEVRIAFHELERQATFVDLASQDAMHELGARLDRQFALTLTAALLLLLVILLAVWLAGREQLAAIDALRASEDQLRRVGDNLPESYVYQYMHGPDGRPRFTYVSAGVERVHGVTPEEVLRDPAALHGLIDPDQLRTLAAAEAESARNLSDFEMDVPMRRRDGTVRQIHLSSRPRRAAAGLVQWDGIATDQTERRRAQEELHATNARYARQEAALMSLTRACALRQASTEELMREITRAAAEALEVERVAIWRQEGTPGALVCRESYERTTRSHASGLSVPAGSVPVLQRALAEGEIVAAQHALLDPRTAELAESYLRPRGITSVLDAPIHLAGGVAGIFCAEHVGSPRRWTADEQTFAIAAANLVSLLLAGEEREQIGEQLRQSQKMEGIGQLAGGVAHDFNNILAAMLMQADMASSAENLPEDVREGLREIRAAAERAANLTRQLLLFSRRQVMQPRVLDLNEVVVNLARMLQRIIGEDVRLQLALAPRPAMTRADAGMLEQVLMNLAVNARDAMPEGGRLSIETSERMVDDELARLHPDAVPGRYVCLTVNDTGAGIPPEVLPHIFEPFFTTKGAGKGTGLGLATVFGIVKQHKGWVSVESQHGLGSTFEVFLPAGESTAEEASPAVPRPRGGTETIFVVEDEAAVRSVTRTVLERAGYRVVEAADGLEALVRWREVDDGVGLLLTDLVMPGGLNGRELARRLRGERPELKVVYFSGYSEELGGRELTLRQGEAFLQKPFAPDKLLEIVRRCLDG